jgi:hypothetical protein
VTSSAFLNIRTANFKREKEQVRKGRAHKRKGAQGVAGKKERKKNKEETKENRTEE